MTSPSAARDVPRPEISPAVAVVLLHWGDVQLTRDALDSLAETRYPTMRAFVVDQGVDVALSLRSNEELIHVRSNVGFCAGNNRALERVMEESFDYVLLLNNDTLVEPDMVQRLVEALEAHPTAVAAGPTVLFEQPADTIWYGGGRYLERKGRTEHLKSNEPFDRSTAGGAVDSTFIVGCAIMMRVDVVRAIGLLDERYFMYWEDSDWCARALAAGHDLLYVPSAVVVHRLNEDRQVNSPRRLYYFLRNWLLFIRLHTSPVWRVRAWAGVANWLVRQTAKVLIVYRANQLEYFRRLALALIDNARRRYGRLPTP